jgi:Icc-related predicted phosphoesterase
VIRRLAVGPRSLTGSAHGGRIRRLLAVSDEVDRALDFERNRDAIAPIEGVIGCGDLDPDYLAFLADAFRVPLIYVRGNHDRGGAWERGRRRLPDALDGRVVDLAGLAVGGLSWPRELDGRAVRDDMAAWRQALTLRLRAWPGRSPQVIISHVPPVGLGDSPEDPYHRGFGAYHWLCRAIRPLLWLHGHTPVAARSAWHVAWGSTTLVNVTGAVVIELTGS